MRPDAGKSPFLFRKLSSHSLYSYIKCTAGSCFFFFICSGMTPNLFQPYQSFFWYLRSAWSSSPGWRVCLAIFNTSTNISLGVVDRIVGAFLGTSVLVVDGLVGVFFGWLAGSRSGGGGAGALEGCFTVEDEDFGILRRIDAQCASGV